MKNKAVVGITALRVIKSIIGIFASSFLMLYFFSLNSNTIVPISIYYLVVYTVVFLSFFVLVNFVKGRNKLVLLWISIFFNCVFFVAIALLKEKVVDYVWLVGLIYGLEEGFYYSAFNLLDSEKISNEKRISYLGFITVIQGLVSILIPIIFGSVLKFMPYDKIAIIILVLVALQMLFSFFVQSVSVNSKEKSNFKEFRKCLNKPQNKAVKKFFVVHFLCGLTIEGSALGSLATLYLISVFSESFQFGISSAVLAVVSMVAGILAAKLLSKKTYKISMWISCIVEITALIILVIFTNTVTIILYNFLAAFFKKIINLQSIKFMYNMSNYKDIKNKFKPEYFLTCELALFVGRIISYSLMLLAGLFYSKFFIGAVLIFLDLAFIPYVHLCNSVNKQAIIDEQNDSQQ